MSGAIIFVIVMVLVVPVAIMFAGAIWSALFGWMSSAGNTDAGGSEQPQ